MSLLSPLIKVLGEQLKSNSRVNSSSPAQLKALQQEYRDAIGLGNKVTLSAEIINELSNHRRKDFSGFFKGTKDKDGKVTLPDAEDAVKKKLDADDDNTKKIKTAIADSLKVSDPFTKAQKDYNESVTAFKKLVEEIPAKYKTGDIIGVMTELKDNARKSIQDQHALEKQEMTTKLASDEVKAALETTFGSPEEAEKAKATLMADLDKGHKAQLDFFDKSTQDSISKLHEASAKEFDRILYLAHLHKNNEAMRKEIEKLMPEPKEGQVEVGMDKDRLYLAGINLDDIKTIQSITGREIHRQTSKDDKGNDTVTYTVQMPRNIFGIAYYLDPRQNPKADMVAIADGIKASGYSSIKMNVNFPDNKELADRRGREAFEACIKAGFDVNKISINVNGEELKGAEIQKKLFAKDGGKYNALVNESANIRKELDKVKETFKNEVDNKSTQGTASLKEAIKGLKAQQPAPDAEEQQQQQPPQLGR